MMARRREGWIRIVLVALMLWGTACAGEAGSGDPDGGDPGAETAGSAPEVAAFLLRHLEALEARDSAQLRQMYAPTFVWLEDGAVRYRRVEELLASLESFPAETRLRTVIGEVEALPAGPGAVHAWTPFATTLGEGPEAFTFSGVLSYVLERRPTGGWIIVGGHTSTDASGDDR